MRQTPLKRHVVVVRGIEEVNWRIELAKLAVNFVAVEKENEKRDAEIFTQQKIVCAIWKGVERISKKPDERVRFAYASVQSTVVAACVGRRPVGRLMMISFRKQNVYIGTVPDIFFEKKLSYVIQASGTGNQLNMQRVRVDL
jgi:hypothetical protein